MSDKRITPENVRELREHQCILIGTNESGIHGAGIAKFAMDHWGARLNQGYGLMGQCFGLPTKDWDIESLPLKSIEFYVERYKSWTQIPRNYKWQHLVTKVGCGLAGFSVPDIAPMFKDFVKYRNIWMPKDFLDFYDGIYKANTNDEGTVLINKQGKTELYDGDGKLYAAQG
jgi:hypothetical protein